MAGVFIFKTNKREKENHAGNFDSDGAVTPEEPEMISTFTKKNKQTV